MKKMFTWAGANFAFLAIGFAYLLAIGSILSRPNLRDDPNKVVIRIAHWQLEAGVRQALVELGKEYQKLHPNVEIVQQAIPESTYQQWVSTQLIGGTAPDIIQAGNMPPNLLLAFYTRYFMPLTSIINQPNPYNRGNELDGIPLRDTYKDSMRTAYVPELGEYMSIPLAQFAFRIFYNRELFQELTGLEKPPETYAEFIAVCRQISGRKNAAGKTVIPIASSGYHVRFWNARQFAPLTFGVLRKVDFNRDGVAGNDEIYAAVRTGLLKFDDPAHRAKYEMIREVTEFFQPGFTGLTRDEALFLFAQGQAVFMPVGSYEARSLREQSEGDFEIGVMNFPWPSKDDPKFGHIIEGPPYEEMVVGFNFAVTRMSKHPEVAIDFLRFLASKSQNERLSQIIGWVPAIRGAEIDPDLAAFDPKFRGVYSAFNFVLGGETLVRWEQLHSLFLVNQIDFEGLMETFGPFYVERGKKDFFEAKRDWRRTILRDEILLADLQAKALMASGEKANELWDRYRVLTVQRVIRPEIGDAQLSRMVNEPESVGTLGPYEYSTEALERIRRDNARPPAPEASSSAPSSP